MSLSTMKTTLEIALHSESPDKQPCRVTLVFYETWRDLPVVHSYLCSQASVNRIIDYALTHSFYLDYRYFVYGAIYGTKWEE